MSALWHDLGYSNRQVVAADASSRNISWANINSVHFYIQQTWLFIEALKTQEKKKLALTELALWKLDPLLLSIIGLLQFSVRMCGTVMFTYVQ